MYDKWDRLGLGLRVVLLGQDDDDDKVLENKESKGLLLMDSEISLELFMRLLFAPSL